MKADDLKALLRNGSKDFQRLNAGAENTVCAGKPKQVAREKVRQTFPSPSVGAMRLVGVDVTFHARHGKLLDLDNRDYAVRKPFQDALVRLGLAVDDQKLQVSVDQRMDNDHAEI